MGYVFFREGGRYKGTEEDKEGGRKVVREGGRYTGREKGTGRGREVS